jgi:hypothetical protein
MLEEELRITTTKVIEQPGFGVAEQSTMARMRIAMAFRTEVQLGGKLLLLDRLPFHLIEILEPILPLLLFLRLLPIEEVCILQMADQGTVAPLMLLLQHRHDDPGAHRVLVHVFHGVWP